MAHKKYAKMRQTLCLVLSLTLVCCVPESAPAGLGTLEFDKLETEFDELSYEIEEEDIDDFSKLLDEADTTVKSNNDNSKPQTNVDASGSKKKKTSTKGEKSSRNIQDLKKFYKSLSGSDQGAYDDGNIYANAEGIAGKAVGIKGKEDRTYRKGTKTRGFRRVHHKDEYKKDKLIYEDDETKGIVNKVGAKAMGYQTGGSAGVSKGHFHHDHRQGLDGREAYSEKGLSDRQFKRFLDSQGFQAAFDNDS